MREQVPGLRISWRWFSLEQVNSVEGPEWKVWDRHPEFRSRSLLAFAAAESARRVAPERFEDFHLSLLAARHVDRLPLHDLETIRQVAADTGLDVAALLREMEAPDVLAPLARDHQEAVAMGVFGTPTLCFENGNSAYLKLRPAPPEHESLEVFRMLCSLIADRAYIEEVKRPRA